MKLAMLLLHTNPLPYDFIIGMGLVLSSVLVFFVVYCEISFPFFV